MGTPDTTSPSVSIQVNSSPVGVGTPVVVSVSVSDASPIESTSLTLNGTPVPFDAQGYAIYTLPALGTYTARGWLTKAPVASVDAKNWRREHWSGDAI